MPELPEVETVRRGLAPHVAGATISDVRLARAGLRFPFPHGLTRIPPGTRIEAVTRRAKYLLFPLSDGQLLISHLGMTGSWRFGKESGDQSSDHAMSAAEAHDHLFITLERDGDAALLIYNDPRRFGFIDLVAPGATSPHLEHLGPEPLGNAMSAAVLAQQLANRKAPIKAALLDQSVIAGLGNIYVSEALWRAGIAPDCLSKKLVSAGGTPEPALDRLVGSIRAVLEDAIAAGGSTLKDFRNAQGETGYFQHSFDVYGRAGEPCRTPGCAGQVVRIVQSGRASFYCPLCQRK